MAAKRTNVLKCGYTFLPIHDIICLTGRKASAAAGGICFYPVWQRRTKGSEHDRMNEENSVMSGDLYKCQFFQVLSGVAQFLKNTFW